MAIQVRCPGCGNQMRVATREQGRNVPCSKCGNEVLVQGPAVADFEVFISYSTADKVIADAACAQMEAAGLRCWIAPRDITPGMEWASAIVDGIERSRVFVLVHSGNANQSQQVMREVERAVHCALPIVPLRIQDVPPSKSLEFYISANHWLDAFTPPMEQHLDKLVRSVKALLNDSRPAKSPATAAAMPASAPALAEPTRSRRGWWGLAAVVLVALAAGAAVAFKTLSGSPTQARQDPPDEFVATAPATRPVDPVATPTTSASTTGPAGITQRTCILPMRPFLVGPRSRNGRKVDLPVTVPQLAPGPWHLEILVDNMGDDSGDTGMYCALFDGHNAPAFRLFSKVNPTVFRHNGIASGSKWTVVLSDDDTSGRGNGGTIAVYVAPGIATVLRTR